eukprot:364191-Chlamydomonas_euryale.AAC.4
MVATCNTTPSPPSSNVTADGLPSLRHCDSVPNHSHGSHHIAVLQPLGSWGARPSGTLSHVVRAPSHRSPLPRCSCFCTTTPPPPSPRLLHRRAPLSSPRYIP